MLADMLRILIGLISVLVPLQKSYSIASVASSVEPCTLRQGSKQILCRCQTSVQALSVTVVAPSGIFGI